MKKFVFLLVILFSLSLAFPPQGFSQTKQLIKKEQRKLDKQKKRAARAKKDAALRKFYAQLIRNKQWVFQATVLYDTYGQTYSVTPDVNFVAVKDNKIILQFGFQGVVGWNGVGGVTAEGFLTDYKFDPGKTPEDAMTITAHIRPKFGGGSPYFTMTIQNDGTSQIMITLENGSLLRMTGQLYSPAQSSVYKGTVFP
jgi:hypothetical protein